MEYFNIRASIHYGMANPNSTALHVKENVSGYQLIRFLLSSHLQP
jgi:hypothetical protein